MTSFAKNNLDFIVLATNLKDTSCFLYECQINAFRNKNRIISRKTRKRPHIKLLIQFDRMRFVNFEILIELEMCVRVRVRVFFFKNEHKEPTVI